MASRQQDSEIKSTEWLQICVSQGLVKCLWLVSCKCFKLICLRLMQGIILESKHTNLGVRDINSAIKKSYNCWMVRLT